MAAAAPSPLASSVEKTNGAKLSKLLIDGGTTVLRKAFDGFHPPANLAADLNTNYLTLHNLYKKKVLYKPQWDLLFPPGGATPDSKTFDITLLFLLLTNICGLSPPLSGWHKPPPSSDTSLEANLTRIKLYRNELYGHVTSTGVQTAVFNIKWQEISAVLVALGLNPADVVRLKSAPCGEDYISAVTEWAKYDEEIMSQLREVLKVEKETRQIQQEHHRTLQDTHKAVEGVQQICQDTHKVVKEVLKTQQEKNHKQQETFERLHQVQLEDRERLQDSKSKLDEVHQTQTKTQETVERVHQTQLEDHQIHQDNKSKLGDIHRTQTETLHVVEGVVKTQKTQEERFETLEAGLQEMKQAVGSLKEGRETDSLADEVLRNLAKSEFKGDIEYHVGRFQEDTREWVFNEVKNWLDDRKSQNRVMVISANAGMGKSVISAVICKRMQEAGRLSGSHFCQHNNARYRNPQLMLQSLACHLCHAFPEYKQALVKQLSRNLGKDLNNMGVEELFALLFKEPLSTVADPGRNMLMVIDGLDESEYQERNKLLDVIANHFWKLPCWIRFLVTTRPERNIAKTLKHLRPFMLEPIYEKNMHDVQLFLEEKLKDLMKPENKAAIMEKLVEKSEGLMLYAYFLISFIEENASVLNQGDLDGSLPLAISSVYHSYFERLENELKKELDITPENFLNLLHAVIAAREPLPIEFVSKVLVPSANKPLARRKVLKAIDSVSSLLPIRDGCLHVIHKSVKDWLTDISSYEEHDFIVEEKEGHRILSSLCADELDHLKLKGVIHTQLSSIEKYTLRHGVRHMLQLDEEMRSRNLEECIQTYVLDLEILYAKLSENSSIAAEDILWLQRQENYQMLSENSQGLLTTLIILLRRNFSTLANHPQLFFQTVLNEGGTVLYRLASDLLKSKYSEIPYMEFVHKQIQQGAVLARFHCSSSVACFDVSPQLDYMVCECEDGTLHLWSLHTGKLMWTRPVKVKKEFPFLRAHREPPSSRGAMSCYRSVVFHPTGKVVLPGVLSHTYNFNGDLEPLFLDSNCSFTVCSISGDKTSMLTDCPEDAKCIIMWSLENGSEITRFTGDYDVLSFAWSRDGKLLAISHSSGFISIVDVVDGLKAIENVTTPKVCGMIKFSPDCRSLFCLHLSFDDYSLFRLNINMAEHPSCTVDVCVKSYVAREFESRSEGGFLLGDPLPFSSDESPGRILQHPFDFVLNKQTVLRGYPVDSFVDMYSYNS